MHEFSLIRDLMRKITDISRRQNSARVIRVRVKLGAMAHISADHFREHFEEAARGTTAEGAQLEIETNPDQNDRHAQDILLESVDIEQT